MGWKQFCWLECQSKSKNKQSTYSCGNVSCKKKFKRKYSQVEKSFIHFCSHKCSAHFYGLKSRKDHNHLCDLPSCNRIVETTTGRKRFCSPECLYKFKTQSSYDQAKIVIKIREFYEKYSRIPAKYELQALYAPARRFFGAWNKAIIAAGYEPNPVMFAKHHIALDGHRCDSLAERIVDDFLYRRGIIHKINVPYPWMNGMTADFVVGKIWIEIFGLEGEHKRYDELKRTKLSLAKQHNIHILSISLREVYRDGLQKKLAILGAWPHRPS